MKVYEVVFSALNMPIGNCTALFLARCGLRMYIWSLFPLNFHAAVVSCFVEALHLNPDGLVSINRNNPDIDLQILQPCYGTPNWHTYLWETRMYLRRMCSLVGSAFLHRVCIMYQLITHCAQPRSATGRSYVKIKSIFCISSGDFSDLAFFY